MIKHKIKEWLKRYLPSEIVGTITAILAASLTRLWSSNLIVIAYAGSLGEAIGFYATVFIQRILIVKGNNSEKNKLFTVLDFAKITGGIILEFGPAGLIDSLLLRPFFMFLFATMLKNFTLGLLVGKFVGDFTFYILVIISYEIKKNRSNRS